MNKVFFMVIAFQVISMIIGLRLFYGLAVFGSVLILIASYCIYRKAVTIKSDSGKENYHNLAVLNDMVNDRTIDRLYIFIASEGFASASCRIDGVELESNHISSVLVDFLYENDYVDRDGVDVTTDLIKKIREYRKKNPKKSKFL
jgi:hypothetical protein